MRTMFRRFGVLMTAIGLMIGLSVVAAAPAHADVTRCALTSSIRIQGYTVPTGQYCISVSGSGLQVNSTSGSWHGLFVEYPTERTTFYDTNGTAYLSAITYRGYGRTWGYRHWWSSISGKARTGSACFQFMSYGTEIGKICVNIKP
ncbi:MAG TPA: hypothetical protein VLA77_02365 [Candidatus Saccharimonadales bacterium]|nr:hypothetical protein [Candidatus Saccharimonadales bacterium]